MKLVITAGGGGHFAPALAVLEALPKETEVLIVGRKYAFEGDKTIALEYRVAKDRNIPFAALTTGRFQRTFTRQTLPSLAKIPYGFVQSILILRKFQPDAVVSFGGYVALPVVVAAALLKIPVVIHEQTQEAGATNKLSARFAKKICISWESSKAFFPKEKIVLTGNPLRSDILDTKENKESTFFSFLSHKTLPLLYITGGSLGSHEINLLVEASLPQLLEHYTVFQQTGDAQQYHDFKRLSALQNKLPEALQERYMLTKFVDPSDTGMILRFADLVVSRSGINTITELLYFGKPSLLIPLPFSQQNEQLKNAQLLKATGIGEICEQRALSPETFYQKIQTMYKNLATYKKDTSVAKRLVPRDAEKKIIETIHAVIKS